MPAKFKMIVFPGEMHIGLGMRNVKTAVAVALCMLIYEAVYRVIGTRGIVTQYSIPLYAGTAAIICMQNTLQQTLSDGISRIVGTLYGGTLGLLVLFINGYIHLSLKIAVIGLAISLSICLCNLTGQQNACAISCVVLLAMVVNKEDSPQYIHALYRLIETIAGIIIAGLVNRFFFVPGWLKSIKMLIIKRNHRLTKKTVTQKNDS